MKTYRTRFSALFMSITILTLQFSSHSMLATKQPLVVASASAVGRIAFSTDRDGNSEIYVMNADGTGQTRLTNHPAHDVHPTWSPDGTHVAFVSKRDGMYEIYVMNADGTGQTRLTNNAWDEGVPAWSPDGKRIAFHRSSNYTYDIYVMNADGSGETRLTTSGANGQPTWSPNGKQIAFVNGNSVIYKMNADGSGKTPLTDRSNYSAGDPAWSPDGSQIAFVTSIVGKSSISVMNNDGSGKAEIISGSDYYGGYWYRTPSWSLDGAHIAFVLELQYYNENIYVIHADGSNQNQLTSNQSGNNWKPTWSAGSRPPATPTPTNTPQPTQSPTATATPTSTPITSCRLPNFGDSNSNPLRQNDDRWKNTPYGGTDYKKPNGETSFLPFRYYGSGKDTIGAWGCTMTSGAMIINYFAAQQGKSFRTDPAKLNTWLQHNGGYYTGSPLPSANNPQYVDTSFVIPSKVVEYATKVGGVQMAWDGTDRPAKSGESVNQFMARTKPTLNNYMCALNPVILGVNNSGHYVDATGKELIGNTETWRIHDPLSTSATTLQAKYANTYSQLIRYSGNNPRSALSIAIHSPVEVIVTDLQGRRAGFDPSTSKTWTEIPSSSYGVDLLAADNGGNGLLEQTTLEILTPITGSYILRTIGTGSGTYTLDVHAVDNEGRGTSVQITGTASAGKTDMFRITYSSTPNQPVKVDALKSVYLPLTLR